MPQQTDEGVPVRIATLGTHHESLVGRKLRIAGRNMSYDVDTGFLILLDDSVGVLVDISLALERERTFPWMKERFSPVEVLGYLEHSDEELVVPAIPPHASAPEVDTHLVLRAIVVVPSSDLSLEVWNNVVTEMEVELGIL
ncbi:hypothetical protein Moror_6405 [Moniliophthora roreri MCA 2997]|uniref:Uncharacterized protein n=2 Tax=Moniliophthora roreri TaxID=221103 RepID=V2XCX4_MONRO|nr:hypothetical protein Moror_6405 [Moniliophthora roreri MCA 2997]